MKYDINDEKLDRALKCALHENTKPDDALHRKILYSWKEENNMKFNMRQKKYKAAISLTATIAGIIIISGIGYAAVTGSGILSSFKNRGNQATVEAEKLVEKKPQFMVSEKKNKLKYIDYNVDEVVCDGYTIYARVTIKPKNPNKYYLVDDSFGALSLNDSVPKPKTDGMADGATSEYAGNNDKKIIRVSCGMVEGSSNSDAVREGEWYEIAENGEMHCYCYFQDTPGLDSYTEKMCIYESEGLLYDNETNGEIITITIDNKSSVNSKKEYKTVADKLDYGIEINKISSITTELGTYVTIEHTKAIEYAPGDFGGISPVLFDENGNEIEVLAGGYGKDNNGKNIEHLNYGVLDMSKVSVGFKRSYDSNHDEIDESIIGPYALEEVK